MRIRKTRAISLRIAITMFVFGNSAWAANECPLGVGALNGTYLHTFRGSVYPNSRQATPEAAGILFVAAGHTRFDGAGNFTWKDSTSWGGLTTLDREVTGTYKIDLATCQGTMNVTPEELPPSGEIARIIAAPDGSEMLFVNSINGIRVTGKFHKVPGGSCSAASFTGTYRSLVDGALLKGGGQIHSNASSLGFSGIGRLVATTAVTGLGSFEWSTTESNSGQIDQRVLRGTHTMNFNGCRITAEVNQECVNGACKNVPAGAWTGRFNTSSVGDEAGYVNTTDNVTVNGWLKRQ